MKFQTYDIDPRLQSYIKLICTMECDEDVDTSHIRVLPDACTEMFINYTSTPIAIIDNDLHKRSIVTFRMSQFRDVQMRKGSGCVAICFYPGMAYPMFRMPMNILSDTTTSLADLWNTEAGEIECKLANAFSNEERVRILQKYLLSKVVDVQQDPAIAYLLEEVNGKSSSLDVNSLAKNIGISQRHLSRKFQQHVGLSPKAFLRVNRFIQSLNHLKEYPTKILTEIGYESGYYDQAHLNHDYQFYTGYSPREVAQSPNILY